MGQSVLALPDPSRRVRRRVSRTAPGFRLAGHKPRLPKLCRCERGQERAIHTYLELYARGSAPKGLSE